MHVHSLGHGRLEERGMELEQRVALGGGAFGEDAYAIARGERGMHVLVGARRLAAQSPADEERARALGDPAGERPIAHLALGHEARGPHRLEGEDVEPGNMVGGDHRAARARGRRLAFHLDRDAHDAQQPGGPPDHERAAARGRGAGEDEAQDQDRGGGVLGHARPAQGAQRAAGARVNA
jgi:hypothetical protein